MIALIDNPPPKRRSQLYLHCGASEVPREAVENTPTPVPTATWHPIPHIELVEKVEVALEANHLEIGSVAHSLTKDGARYFGLMEIRGRDLAVHDQYSFVIGLRNAHDKMFPASLLAGSVCFLCDNLAFSGQIRVARRHTTHIRRDLVSLVHGAMGMLMSAWHDHAKRIEVYKGYPLADEQMHDIAIRAVDLGILSNRNVPTLLHEWREPRHEEFAARNMHSAWNAFTETLKGNLSELPRRTDKLHGLLDFEVGWSSN